jgi:glycosyltransferase involved in cell wall biosynthesis
MVCPATNRFAANHAARLVVICLASHREGCPNVVVEALACGLPVVAADVGGVHELVKQNCGRLVSPPTAENFAAEIRAALSAVWKREEIAGFGGARSWQKVAAEVRHYFAAAENSSKD